MAREVTIKINAEDRTGGVVDGIRGRLQSVGIVAVGALGAGLGAVGAGLGLAAGAGLNFNNQMEQVEAQLNAFLKDGDLVAETLDMIRTRAASTPFAFGDMANAVAGLIPAAKQSGQEVEDLVALAEILAASNPAEGLEGAAFSLREALSGDFASIIERFNLPRQRLNELKEEGVPALEAVSIAMQELGLDSELVTNLSQTATGRLSTIKDNLLGIASELTQPIFDRVSDSLGTFLSFLDDNEEAIDSFVSNVVDGVSEFMRALDEGFLAIEEGGDALDFLLGFLDQLFWAFGLNTEILYDFEDRIRGTIAQVQETAAPILEFISNNVQLQDVMIALGIILATVIVPIIAGLVVSIVSIVAPVLAVIAVVALVRTAWENNWGGIQEKTAAVLEFLRGAIQAGLDWIRNFWTQNGDQILATASSSWDSIRAAVDTALQAIQTVITTVINWAVTFWENNGDRILESAQNTWDGIQEAIDIALGIIQDVIDAFTAAFEGDWFTFGEKIVEIAVGFMDLLKSAFNTHFDNIKILFGDKIEELKQKFLNIDWKQLGKDIIDGIREGITNAAVNLASAVAEAARGALSAAKSALGVESPSRVFADEVGVPIVQGIQAGISAQSPSLNKDLRGLGAGAVNNSRNSTITQIFNVSKVDARSESQISKRFALGGI